MADKPQECLCEIEGSCPVPCSARHDCVRWLRINLDRAEHEEEAEKNRLGLLQAKKSILGRTLRAAQGSGLSQHPIH